MRVSRAMLNRTYSRVRNTASMLYERLLVAPGFATGSTVARQHFRQRNIRGHVNEGPITLALGLLGTQSALIVETGSSAYGTDSTRLWAKYVSLFGGRALSVDLSPLPAERLGDLGPLTSLHVEDSVNFLRRLQLPQGFEKIDLLFLDSWDVDLRDPEPSMNHGRSELLAAMKFLARGSLVLIDDTPVGISFWGQNEDLAENFRLRTGMVPGKGRAILNDDNLMAYFEVLHHSYSVLLRYR